MGWKLGLERRRQTHLNENRDEMAELAECKDVENNMLVATVASSRDIVLLALGSRVVAVLGILIVRGGGGRLGRRGIGGLVANVDDTVAAG